MTEAKRLTAPVPPGGTIGILGGGQLGRMLVLAAARLGLKAHVFSDKSDSPAFDVACAHTAASYTDRAALARFAAACDAATFEFENIPADTAAFVAERVALSPGARSLAMTQDRAVEKNFILSLGLQTPAFAEISTEADAGPAVSRIGTPAVMKTRRFGYDGKGQAKIDTADDAVEAFAGFHHAPSILEGFVDFAFEASVIAARARDGDFVVYDPPTNVHENHILRRSTVPSKLDAAQVSRARMIAHRIADGLDYVGVLAVELFVCRDGSLMVNEIAPRVHNSGHWTMDACLVSQFEQHIRAIAGWPLGSPERHADAVMENIIGEEAADWHKLSESCGALHLYGKKERKPGRKMGHITRLGPKTLPQI
ncbi:MAG: 5-(carboxyamino)imidazole ribonucleotide synthase [Alphaproteobacteria bacterium]|nr:5-(carboxyamino)imidazole ribonucleotide synthase [Alphaproteobacteria bacterium]